MATATKEKNKLRLQPLGERLVVQREESEDGPGGILLPDTAKEKPTRGKVIAVGNGRLLKDGTRSALQLKAVTACCSAPTQAKLVEVDGEEYLLLREDDVFAVLEG